MSSEKMLPGMHKAFQRLYGYPYSADYKSVNRSADVQGFTEAWQACEQHVLERLRSDGISTAIFNRLREGVLKDKKVTFEHCAISAATCSALIALLTEDAL